ncbi:MAG: exonuclease domain-containing protein [Gammaproteobacteria bacterium]|nr:exonuclease domain-containing protein [Gammaproteobacteria bacterium]
MKRCRFKRAYIDLEATCWADQIDPAGEPQSVQSMEIIEVGCALTTRQGELLDSCSFLVRPTRYPELSEFCQALTGITQDMVDSAPTFPDAIAALNSWLGQPADSFIWCSWGNYDRLHIVEQCQQEGVAADVMSYPHLNLKRIWRRTTGQKRRNGLASALAYHQLDFEGRPHRGVDDARNMVRLLGVFTQVNTRATELICLRLGGTRVLCAFCTVCEQQNLLDDSSISTCYFIGSFFT